MSSGIETLGKIRFRVYTVNRSRWETWNSYAVVFEDVLAKAWLYTEAPRTQAYDNRGHVIAGRNEVVRRRHKKGDTRLIMICERNGVRFMWSDVRSGWRRIPLSKLPSFLKEMAYTGIQNGPPADFAL